MTNQEIVNKTQDSEDWHLNYNIIKDTVGHTKALITITQ